MKTLALVIPSQSYRAEAFLKAAARLSVEIVIISDIEQALAPVMGDRFLKVPLSEPQRAAEMIVALSQRRPIDGIVGVDDQSALCAAYVGKHLGLVHNEPDAVAMTRDKALMRARLQDAPLDQPRFLVAKPQRSQAIGEECAALADALGYPVVIKPVSLAASRGVIRADDADAARRAGTWAHAIAKDAGCGDETPLLVEEFIEGGEVALEGRLVSGELSCLALFDKPDPLNGPFFEESIYVTPSELDSMTQARVVDTVAQACRALGLREGPVHAEARIVAATTNVAAKVVFLEVAARTIGGRCAKVLEFKGDVSIEQIVIADALGIELGPIEPAAGASGVMMLPIADRGRLVGVAGQTQALSIEAIIGIEITAAPGRLLRPYPEADRYVGFVFASSTSRNRVIDALRQAEQLLDIQVAADESIRALVEQ